MPAARSTPTGTDSYRRKVRAWSCLKICIYALDRGANILAEVAGLGVSADAFHSVEPDEDGKGAARAIRWALKDAEMSPGDIDYINAHGTSTPKNDLVETLAIKLALGEHAYQIPISSTKSMIGHALGASGALEGIAAILSIVNDEIHPTINLETPDPDCDLDYVPIQSRKQAVNTAMSNSFGFGGQNSSLIFKSFEE